MSLLPEIFTCVAAALVTAWFAKSSDDKKNSLTYITDERRKWRTEIRLRTVKIVGIVEKLKKDSDDSENLIELKKSRAFFEIRLNPFDEEDQAILQTLKEIADGQYNKLDEFQGRIALLLKHDWERSKTEVNNKGKVAFIMFTILLCAFQSFLFKGKNKIIDIALDNGLSFCGEGTCEICDSVLKNQIATKSVNFIRQFLHFLQDSCVLNTILWILTIISAYYLVSIVLSIFSSKILKDYNTNRCVNIFFELFGVTTRVSHEEKECVFENKFCCIVLKIVVLAIILGLVCFFAKLLMPIFQSIF